jgi:ArsR family transcriptional regulator
VGAFSLASEPKAVALLFKALADPVRLRILLHLARNPGASCCGPEPGVCACDLERLTGLAQPTVSHHMARLTSVGLVRAEKRGRWVYYRLEPQGLAQLRAFLSHLETAPVPQEVGR